MKNFTQWFGRLKREEKIGVIGLFIAVIGIALTLRSRGKSSTASSQVGMGLGDSSTVPLAGQGIATGAPGVVTQTPYDVNISITTPPGSTVTSGGPTLTPTPITTPPVVTPPINPPSPVVPGSFDNTIHPILSPTPSASPSFTGSTNVPYPPDFFNNPGDITVPSLPPAPPTVFASNPVMPPLPTTGPTDTTQSPSYPVISVGSGIGNTLGGGASPVPTGIVLPIVPPMPIVSDTPSGLGSGPSGPKYQ